MKTYNVYIFKFLELLFKIEKNVLDNFKNKKLHDSYVYTNSIFLAALLSSVKMVSLLEMGSSKVVVLN